MHVTPNILGFGPVQFIHLFQERVAVVPFREFDPLREDAGVFRFRPEGEFRELPIVSSVKPTWFGSGSSLLHSEFTINFSFKIMISSEKNKKREKQLKKLRVSGLLARRNPYRLLTMVLVTKPLKPISKQYQKFVYPFF